MFKKRVIKGKFRPELDEPVANSIDNESDESLTTSAMIQIKLEQSTRKKRFGTEFSSDADAVVEKSEKRLKSSVQKSIEATLGSQFESRVDDGLSTSAFGHEKIMEQYINQRMGITDASIAPASMQVSQEDDLYRLPDDIKFVSAISNPEGTKEEDKEIGGGDQFMSLGLAEVALPMSFKLSNIEETDESRLKFEAERQAKYRNSRQGNKYLNSGTPDIPATGTARFWNPSMSSFIQQQERDKSKASEVKSVVSGPSIEVASNPVAASFTKPGANEGRRTFSNDDQIMQKFKNQQKNKR